ncbi:MAG: hypothetical protein HIU89_15935 [Proteobacteria bacterium]|nr:hypothetical protein [Pseudomonadota bacterium]
MNNANNKPRVEIFVRSNIGHLQQLYAGFSALHCAGEIDLVQHLKPRPNMIASAEPHLRDARLSHCSVLVNKKYRIYYDMHDSWEVDEEALGKHDFYYKRSFQPDRYSKTFHGFQKLRAYGLNYEVVSDPVDIFALQRSLLARSTREFLTAMGWATGLANLWQFVPSLSRMETPPPIDAPTTVLFMARTWDPNESSSELDTKRKIDRDAINQMRANCIRALRDAFGESFFGGFAPSAFASMAYPDLVLNNKSYKKRNYIDTLRSSTIGVTTAGLHGSIGWKMAEYVAFSRAIVSEKFDAAIPGNFSETSNYLSFQNADECVNQVRKLVNDDELRRRMMRNNRDYYLKYLCPKKQVARSLDEMMSRPAQI